MSYYRKIIEGLLFLKIIYNKINFINANLRLIRKIT